MELELLCSHDDEQATVLSRTVLEEGVAVTSANPRYNCLLCKSVMFQVTEPREMPVCYAPRTQLE